MSGRLAKTEWSGYFTEATAPGRWVGNSENSPPCISNAWLYSGSNTDRGEGMNTSHAVFDAHTFTERIYLPSWRYMRCVRLWYLVLPLGRACTLG